MQGCNMELNENKFTLSLLKIQGYEIHMLFKSKQE